jgi:alpha-galactosidase
MKSWHCRKKVFEDFSNFVLTVRLAIEQHSIINAAMIKLIIPLLPGFSMKSLCRYAFSRSALVLVIVLMAGLVLNRPVIVAQVTGNAKGPRPVRQATVAPTPPMGWNSWDCYGTTVTEPEVKAQADYLAKHLARYGWQYIVVDIQWYEPNAKAHGYRENAELVMDDYGRLLPATNRFPSAANGKGFKPLADYIHRQGLKFGIHIMRGIPRLAVKNNLPVRGTGVRAQDVADTKSICKWNTDMYGVDVSKPAGQSYYDSIVELYAQWGVDYIKADDMSSPFHEEEIAALSRAIARSGRAIVLSLSPGPAPVARGDFLQRHAQLWRISNDFWDRWEDLRKQFEYCRQWSPFIGRGSWPDADMLPLGRIGIRAERGNDRQTRFTRDEQFMLMTLWLIFRSPLMFGGDLPSNDAFTLSLLTNAEALAVLRNSSGNHELFAHDKQIAWVADVAGTNDKYLAVFNLDDHAIADIKVQWREIGLSGRCTVRDLWQKKGLGVFDGEMISKLPPHGAALYRVSARK